MLQPLRSLRLACPLALAAAVLLTLAAPLAGVTPAPDDFDSSLAGWKKNRDERLRRPDGWLTLVGLGWLEPGENRVGSAAESRVVLPKAAPASVGTLQVDGERIRFTAAPGVAVRGGGKPVTSLDLADDRDGAPTVLEVGTVSFYAIRRAGRAAVRIKDSAAPALAAFRGLDYYPADRRWRVEARFEPAPTPREVEVPNVLGYVEKMPSPGHVVFRWDGAEHRLLALDDTGDGRLFLVFGDTTNGRATYGGGRFLYTDPPVDGRVVIDFNRAYNPPCVFSPYATCPLPPRGNKLLFAIEAGEKKYALAVHE